MSDGQGCSWREGTVDRRREHLALSHDARDLPVAIVGPDERLLFANPAMRVLVPDAAAGAALDALVPAEHALRKLAEETLVTGVTTMVAATLELLKK